MLVFPYSTSNGYYVYDGSSGRIFEVDDHIYKWFLESTTENFREPSSVPDEIIELQSNGFLSFNSLNHISPNSIYLNDHIISSLDKIQGITIKLTDHCNLSCSYCCYSKNTYSNMSVSSIDIATAYKSIDFLYKHSPDTGRLIISFYGGEPLLCFDTLSLIVEYCHKLFSNRSNDIVFSITTNLTLLTDDIMDFLSSNNFSVAISLDGPKYIHDKNRIFPNGDGSYDSVLNNLDRFMNEVSNNHISSPTILITLPLKDRWITFIQICHYFESLSDNYNNLINFRINSEHSYTHGSRDESSNIDILDNSFHYYISGKSLNLNLNPIIDSYITTQLSPIINRFYFSLNNHTFFTPTGMCIPGSQKLFVDTSGTLFTCERVDYKYSIGDVYKGFNYKTIHSLYENWINQTCTKCHDCWAWQLCNLCLASCRPSLDPSRIFSDNLCSIEKDSLANLFIMYSSILESNPNAFDNVTYH